MLPGKDRRRRLVPTVNTIKRKVPEQNSNQEANASSVQHLSPKTTGSVIEKVVKPLQNVSSPVHEIASLLQQISSPKHKIASPMQKVTLRNQNIVSPGKSNSRESKEFAITPQKTLTSIHKDSVPFLKHLTQKVITPTATQTLQEINLSHENSHPHLATKIPQKAISSPLTRQLSREVVEHSSHDGLKPQHVMNVQQTSKDNVRKHNTITTKIVGNIDEKCNVGQDNLNVNNSKKTSDQTKFDVKKTPDGNTKIFILSPAELKTLGINLNTLGIPKANARSRTRKIATSNIQPEAEIVAKSTPATYKKVDVKKTLFNKLITKNKNSIVETLCTNDVLTPPPSCSKSREKLETRDISIQNTPPLDATIETSLNMETAAYIKNYLIFSPKEGISNYVEGYKNISQNINVREQEIISVNPSVTSCADSVQITPSGTISSDLTVTSCANSVQITPTRTISSEPSVTSCADSTQITPTSGSVVGSIVTNKSLRRIVMSPHSNKAILLDTSSKTPVIVGPSTTIVDVVTNIVNNEEIHQKLSNMEYKKITADDDYFDGNNESLELIEFDSDEDVDFGLLCDDFNASKQSLENSNSVPNIAASEEADSAEKLNKVNNEETVKESGDVSCVEDIVQTPNTIIAKEPVDTIIANEPVDLLTNYKNIEMIFKSLSKSIIVSENGELLPVSECDNDQSLQKNIQQKPMEILTVKSPIAQTKDNNVQVNVKNKENLDSAIMKSSVAKDSNAIIVSSSPHKFNEYMSPKTKKLSSGKIADKICDEPAIRSGHLSNIPNTQPDQYEVSKVQACSIDVVPSYQNVKPNTVIVCNKSGDGKPNLSEDVQHSPKKVTKTKNSRIQCTRVESVEKTVDKTTDPHQKIIEILKEFHSVNPNKIKIVKSPCSNYNASGLIPSNQIKLESNVMYGVEEPGGHTSSHHSVAIPSMKSEFTTYSVASCTKTVSENVANKHDNETTKNADSFSIESAPEDVSPKKNTNVSISDNINMNITTRPSFSGEFNEIASKSCHAAEKNILNKPSSSLLEYNFDEQLICNKDTDDDSLDISNNVCNSSVMICDRNIKVSPRSNGRFQNIKTYTRRRVAKTDTKLIDLPKCTEESQVIDVVHNDVSVGILNPFDDDNDAGDPLSLVRTSANNNILDTLNNTNDRNQLSKHVKGFSYDESSFFDLSESIKDNERQSKRKEDNAVIENKQVNSEDENARNDEVVYHTVAEHSLTSKSSVNWETSAETLNSDAGALNRSEALCSDNTQDSNIEINLHTQNLQCSKDIPSSQVVTPTEVSSIGDEFCSSEQINIENVTFPSLNALVIPDVANINHDTAQEEYLVDIASSNTEISSNLENKSQPQVIENQINDICNTPENFIEIQSHHIESVSNVNNMSKTLDNLSEIIQSEGNNTSVDILSIDREVTSIVTKDDDITFNNNEMCSVVKYVSPVGNILENVTSNCYNQVDLIIQNKGQDADVDSVSNIAMENTNNKGNIVEDHTRGELFDHTEELTNSNINDDGQHSDNSTEFKISTEGKQSSESDDEMRNYDDDVYNENSSTVEDMSIDQTNISLSENVEVFVESKESKVSSNDVSFTSTNIICNASYAESSKNSSICQAPKKRMIERVMGDARSSIAGKDVGASVTNDEKVHSKSTPKRKIKNALKDCQSSTVDKQNETDCAKKYVSQRLLNKKLRNYKNKLDQDFVYTNETQRKRKRKNEELETPDVRPDKKIKLQKLNSKNEKLKSTKNSTPISDKTGTTKRMESGSSDEEIPLSSIVKSQNLDSKISETPSNKRGQRLKKTSCETNELLEVTKKDHSRNKKQKVDEIKSESSEPGTSKLRKDEVKCGVCSQIIKNRLWNNHSLNKHYYLAWIDGETKLDITNQSLLTSLLNKALKILKKLTCSLCSTTKASAVGYISHINICKKTPEEIEAYKILCTICNMRVFPSSFPYHLSKHAQENKKPKIIEDIQDTPAILSDTKRKRKAATVAEDMFKKISSEITSDNVNNLFTKGWTPKMTKRLETIWKTQIQLDNKAMCTRKSCSHTETNVDDMTKHYLTTCKYLVMKPHVCKVCKYQNEDEDNMREHIRSKHPGIENVKPESEAEDFDGDDLSSESDNYDDSGSLSEDSGKEARPIKLKSQKSLVKKPSSIGSISGLEGSFRFSFDQHGSSETVLRKQIKSWMEVVKQRIYCGVGLFPEFHCNEFIVVSDDEMESYLPLDRESCNVSHITDSGDKVHNIQWRKYKLFQSEIVNGIQTFWCGGSIHAVDYLPSSYDHAFVAVSASSSLHDRYREVESYEHKGLVQIWDLGCLNNEHYKCLSPATMALSIAHDHGVVWDLSWCPSGCDDYWPDENWTSSRMGLLAMACSDGQAYIYAICHPDTLPYRDIKIWKTDPVIELRLSARVSDELMLGGVKYQATQVSWSQDGVHNILAVGYSNGIVAYFNTLTKSSLLKCRYGNTTVILPYKVFQACPCRITGLMLLPQIQSTTQESPLVVTSNTGCDIWRGDYLTYSRSGGFTGVGLPLLFPEVIGFSDNVHPTYTRSYSIPLAVSSGSDTRWQTTDEGCQVGCLMYWSSTMYTASYQGQVTRHPYKSPFISRHRSNKFSTRKRALCWYTYAVDLNCESFDVSRIRRKKELIKLKKGVQPVDSNIAESLASYKETTDKYGLIIADVPSTSTVQENVILNVENMRMWPLWEQLCIKNSLNENYSNFAISGSRPGFCRNIYVHPVVIA